MSDIDIFYKFYSGSMEYLLATLFALAGIFLAIVIVMSVPFMLYKSGIFVYQHRQQVLPFLKYLLKTVKPKRTYIKKNVPLPKDED